jgi:hypothetical protein
MDLQQIVGSYSDDFEWVIGVTPLSHPVTIITTMSSYFVLSYLFK